MSNGSIDCIYKSINICLNISNRSNTHLSSSTANGCTRSSIIGNIGNGISCCIGYNYISCSAACACSSYGKWPYCGSITTIFATFNGDFASYNITFCTSYCTINNYIIGKWPLLTSCSFKIRTEAIRQGSVYIRCFRANIWCACLSSYWLITNISICSYNTSRTAFSITRRIDHYHIKRRRVDNGRC